MTTNRIKVLESFDNSKLIDVVKNYRQYGYEDILRDTAIKILKDRGVDIDLLEKKGDLHNSKFELAQEFYHSYLRNSLYAFICYLVSFFIPILVLALGASYENIGVVFIILRVIMVLAFFILFIRSLMNQSEFYKLIAKDVGAWDVLIYIIIGMPFYIIFYFIYRRQMREEMKMIK